MGYHKFETEDGEACGGSFEVFHFDPSADAEACLESDDWTDGDGELLPAGYYWWACFPGCIPDGPPSGPYETYDEAVEAAQEV